MDKELDRIDFELVRLLQKNARLSQKELAAAVGLAPSTCLVRLQRLRQQGVLVGFHAEVDPQAMGIQLQALIAVRMKQHSRAQVKALWKHLTERPEVLTVFHTAGAHDFLVHVAARDAEHLRDLAMDSFTSRPEVAQIETSLLFDQARNPVLPLLKSLPSETGTPPKARPKKR